MDKEKIKDFTISPDESILSAMKKISSNNGHAIFIVSSQLALQGSITDGDIRRALLHGTNLNCPVFEMMNKRPKTVSRHEKDFHRQARKQMRLYQIKAIPVIDENNHIVDILLWDDVYKRHSEKDISPISLDNKVVIMAGGKGSRLDPFTKILPKPLIPIGEKPIIEKIMSNFYRYGFRHFILTLNYKKELIKAWLKERSLPYQVEWVEETQYLGTAGGLRLLKGSIQETFFVINCDTLIDADPREILKWHKKENAALSLVGCHKEMIIPYGTLEMKDGQLKSVTERPRCDFMINTGLYVMEPEILGMIPPEEPIDMNQLIEKINREQKVTVYALFDGWSDVGQWSDYHQTVYHLQNRFG